MAIRPILIDAQSPFIEESCALCKEPFNAGQEIIVCPDDAARHHLDCWRANGDRCSAYGCQGSGAPIVRRPLLDFGAWRGLGEGVVEGEVVGVPGSVTRTDDGSSKIRALPASSLSCAQSCLILAIALTLIIFAVSCFGLWYILDYLMINVFDMPYREPLSLLGPALAAVV
jgi:hypothetical protein